MNLLLRTKNLAKAFARRVFPTPDGPIKIKLALGLFGFCRPALDLLTAFATALIALSCPITVLQSSFSISSNLFASFASIRLSGIPVMVETTSVITASSTVPSISVHFSRHSFSTSLFFFFNLSALSLSFAALSKSCNALRICLFPFRDVLFLSLYALNQVDA